MIEILFLLFVKHFIVDFPLQTSYQYLNKGKYLHFGGILHSSLHGVATFICFLFAAPDLALIAATIDFVVHYHVDYLKVNVNNKFNWKPNTHEEFWWLLGLDQLIHTLTYLYLVSLI